MKILKRMSILTVVVLVLSSTMVFAQKKTQEKKAVVREHLANGDFEDLLFDGKGNDWPEGWGRSIPRPRVRVKDPKTGKYVYKYKEVDKSFEGVSGAGKAGSGEACVKVKNKEGGLMQLTTSVYLMTNKKYVFSIKVKGADRKARLRWLIKVYERVGGINFNMRCTKKDFKAVTFTPEWKKHTSEITFHSAKTKPVRASLTLYFWGPKNAMPVYIDSVSLKPAE